MKPKLLYQLNQYDFIQVLQLFIYPKASSASSNIFVFILTIQNGYRQFLIILILQELMGQKNTKEYNHQQMNMQKITKVMDDIFANDPQKLTLQIATSSGYTLFRYLSIQGAFRNKQGLFYVNPILLRCVFSINFQQVVHRLLVIMIDLIKSIMEAKILAVVPRQKFKKLLTLTSLIVYFIDQNLLRTFNYLSIRSDLHQESRDLLSSLDIKEVPEQLMEDYDTADKIQLCRMLRLFIMQMIDLHTKLFTRSQTTFAIIDVIIKMGFILYCKTYFSQKSEISMREKGQNNKSIAKIAAYAMGLGIQTNSSAVYEAGVILLSSIIDTKASSFNNLKAFPSHMFKNLPIVNNNSLFHWVVCNIMNILIYKVQGLQNNSKLSINRIYSCKLLQLIFKHCPNIQSKQITYYLQKICLQTRPQMIERVYISNIAQIYCINNLNLNSQIIKLTSKTKQINFNIKTLNKNIKIKPEDIMTQLQNDDESFYKEMIGISSKFILQTVFEKIDIKYQYSDKSLWNQILHKLDQEEKEAESTEQLQNVAQDN